ncbi:cytochrome ubiquinol oxidase subunit I [Blastococcus brunescens]|uniref:Cytochrome ubiquinol oxidase subunit I n=1 Tax=Blastococcus brunescens TaxID=1564165 RepID=A0ABZ1AUI6_9ACTN|nr:cytochrome ubiquinol oxidase subunit I [Blastococcus sp. BMG 8361]WRL61802.1 cytochrome ubiquinol oxidase subunit I [Blastococcus sp. BMG 8361]
MGASILAGESPGTRILGLEEIPDEYRPSDRLVNVVHLAFDVMVSIGFLLLGLSLWWGLAWWRRRRMPASRWFLRGTAVSGLLAVIAMEAGWIVTEVGRQPWIVVGHMLTRDAVATEGNLWLFYGATVALYAALAAGTVLALRLLRRRWAAEDAGGPEDDDTAGVPYGPSRARMDGREDDP